MNDVFKYGIRFLGLVLFQVIVLNNIDLNFGAFNYFHFIIYPLFIFLLPVRTPKFIIILLGFFTGLTIDMFYDSPGVHASALTLTAFIRSSILKLVEPVEGFSTSSSPNPKTLGYSSFFIYVSILLFVHLVMYFGMEAFSLLYLFEIILSAIFSFIISILLLILVQLIFRI